MIYIDIILVYNFEVPASRAAGCYHITKLNFLMRIWYIKRRVTIGADVEGKRVGGRCERNG